MVRRTLLSAALATVVPGVADACHEEPRDSYAGAFNVGLHVGLAFGGTGVELIYGADVRVGTRHTGFVRVEGRGIVERRLRLAGGFQLVHDGKAGEVGASRTSATAGTGRPGASLGAFAAVAAWDPNGNLTATATIPFQGDLQNWDVGLTGALVLPGKLCMAGGRLLRAGDRAIVPDGWVVDADDADDAAADADVAAARVRARYFARAARIEAASVPAFVRLARELAALGAPERLVRDAWAAADDERRHVGLARSLAGAPVGVLALDPSVAAARWRGPSPDALATLAREAWLDGCLGEGVAAAEADAAAAGARTEPVRATLRTIGHDEAQHAALAWDVLGWCRDQGADGRAAVADAIARAPEPVDDDADDADDERAPPADPAWLAAHGIASATVRACLRDRVFALARARAVSFAG